MKNLSTDVNLSAAEAKQPEEKPATVDMDPLQPRQHVGWNDEMEEAVTSPDISSSFSSPTGEKHPSPKFEYFGEGIWRA